MFFKYLAPIKTIKNQMMAALGRSPLLSGPRHTGQTQGHDGIATSASDLTDREILSLLEGKLARGEALPISEQFLRLELIRNLRNQSEPLP
jgi:hypothetical protein